MNVKTLRLLQICLWLVCAFHLITGAGLNLSTGFVDAAAQMYGAEVSDWSPQFLYILRPLGVFMVALGVFAGAAALDPQKHRLTIYVFAGIFVIRALHRLVFGAEITDIFGIAGSRNVVNMIFFFGMAAVLIGLDLYAHRSSSSGQPAAT